MSSFKAMQLRKVLLLSAALATVVDAGLMARRLTRQELPNKHPSLLAADSKAGDSEDIGAKDSTDSTNSCTGKLETACKADQNCFWDGRNDQNTCEDSVPWLIIGGDAHENHYDDGKAYRPEFMVMQRQRTDGTWESCEGSDPDNCANCWCPQTLYGPSVVGHVDSSYKRIALEVPLRCDATSEDVTFKMFSTCSTQDAQRPSNADLKMWYNGNRVNFDIDALNSTGCNGDKNWLQNIRKRRVRDHRRREPWTNSLATSVNSDHDLPILRVEMETLHRRRRQGTGEEAKAAIRLSLRKAKISFEECMTQTQQHGACLEDIPIGAILRSNHTLQDQCLTAYDRGNANTQAGIVGCVAWANCLGTNATDFFKAAIQGFARVEQDSLLEAASYRMSSSVNSTTACTATNTDVDDGECIDPETFDVEAFDCNCFDHLQGKSHHQFHDWACCHPKACCAWKVAHCKSKYWDPDANSYPSACTNGADGIALLQRSGGDKVATEKTAHSFETSLQGKCR